MSKLVLLALGLWVVAACGNSNVLTTDGSTDATTDALTCGPSDVSTFVPANMNPPSAPHAGKCNAQQIGDYAQCNGAKNTPKCSEFGSGQPGAACAACIETQSSSATWGVIVFDVKTNQGTVNIEGCVDAALGQVSQEPSSCGQLLHASYTCQEAACGGCTGSNFDTCDLLALVSSPNRTEPQTPTGGCAKFDAQVKSSTGPCSAALDALTPDVKSCFPDTTITDATAQEVQWLTSIITFMCGS